jgi:hypothetical protein
MNATPDARIGHIISVETVQTALLIIASVVGTWLCLYRVPWQVSGDPCLVAAAATMVIVPSLWLTRWRGLRAVNFERHLLAGFLAAMPLVYLTRYLFATAGQSTSSWFWVEALGVLVFAALAFLGVKLSPRSTRPPRARGGRAAQTDFERVRIRGSSCRQRVKLSQK